MPMAISNLDHRELRQYLIRQKGAGFMYLLQPMMGPGPIHLRTLGKKFHLTAVDRMGAYAILKVNAQADTAKGRPTKTPIVYPQALVIPAQQLTRARKTQGGAMTAHAQLILNAEVPFVILHQVPSLEHVKPFRL